MSTPRDTMMGVGGYQEYNGMDTMMSAGGYHEYPSGCSVHWGFHTNSVVFPMTSPTFIMISSLFTHIPLVY